MHHKYILILKMFNKILILGHVPKEWCCEMSHQSIKKGSKLDPENYRRTCVMNALLKVFCLTINQRLQAFLTKNNTINRAQIGFMQKGRATDHIYTLKTLCNKYVKDKKVVNYLPALSISKKRKTRYGMKDYFIN